MAIVYTALLIWLGLMVLVWAYVQDDDRHDLRRIVPLLAIMSLVLMVVVLMFVDLSYFASLFGVVGVVKHPLGALLLLAAFYLSARLLSRRRLTPGSGDKPLA